MSVAVSVERLSPDERDEFETLKALVHRNLATYVETAQALLTIRDRRLYRETHATWEQFLQKEFRFKRAHAHRLIQAGEIAAVTSPVGYTPANERQARELVPLLSLRDGEAEIVEAVRELCAEYGDDEITAQRVKRLVGDRLKRVRREQRAFERSLEPAPEPTRDIQLHHCDLRDLAIADASADLFFTDPPYPAEYLPAWETLAALAARALKPGGLLVAYSGQKRVPEVMRALGSRLEYVWLGSLVHQNANNREWERCFFVGSKPLLFYARAPYTSSRWCIDTYRSEGRDKRYHEWGQSIGAAHYYIKALTNPGALVVDPFLGGGTVAVAARDLGRRFIGCDIDATCVETTKRRLAECCQDEGDNHEGTARG